MNEMREARIVMPEVHAIGPKPHDTLRAALCGAFGGFTMTYGVGGWVDGDHNVIRDSVCIYDVAMEQTRKNDSKLRDIAVEAGKALGQQSVYLRYSSGSTTIISLTPPARPDVDDEDTHSGAAQAAAESLGVDTYEQLGDLSSMRGQLSGGIRQLGKAPGTEAEKATRDAMLYGAGFMKDGKHIPAAEAFVKRLPQVGEIWLARDGATRIAVLKQATLLDGGFECVTLTKGATALREGYPIVVDLDGRYIRGVPQETHPLDLVQCQFNFII